MASDYGQRGKYKAGGNDVVTGRPITKEVYKEAGKIKFAFQFMKTIKKAIGSKNIQPPSTPKNAPRF